MCNRFELIVGKRRRGGEGAIKNIPAGNLDEVCAESLLLLCEEGSIEKYRYLVKAGNHTYEIDEFLGDNKNLIVAEIELLSEEETFLKPNWIAEEVKGNVLYYNSNLSKHPFKDWR